MSGTTNLRIATSRIDFVSRCEKPKKLNSAFSGFYTPPYSPASLSFSGSFINFASFRQIRSTTSFSMATPISVKADASSTIDRGAHTYWLERGTLDVRPDHILNLIHYEDAASLSVTIFEKKLRGKIFLGCDNHPLSRQELMDLVNKSGKYSKKFEAFTGPSDPLGKKLNNPKTRAEFGWEPKYTSFAQFLESL
ncbi:hypothetical protein CASFOL_005280 [Castilleja foliolosa]|uniref:NAD(P)-binding domain-containing protein n=1 Tax=Castilleja foliolosa TaxID=1961234 RepID=A0ABD3E507_9LAMI